MTNRETTRFRWAASDITISDNIDIPDRLKSVIDKAPGDDQLLTYLTGFVERGEITLDDVDFITSIIEE